MIETEVIAYKTIKEETDSLSLGETSVKTSGEDGSKDDTYKVSFDKDGNELEREVVFETITLEPITEILLIGTKVDSNSKVTTEEVIKNETIKYTTKEVKTNSLYIGERKVQTQGVNGAK